MSAKAGKRPLRSLTAHEKLDAIRRVHDGESKASVARDIGVPESTLRGWCKNEDKISYLSRQSSPETDDSINMEPKEKKSKLEENVPFNLSLKIRAYSPPNSDTVFNGKTVAAATTIPIETEKDLKHSSLSALSVTPETPKSTHMTERERNRAELARLSIELGLNRPEMFNSKQTAGNTLTDLTTNIGLLAQWNSLLLQQQQKLTTKKTTSTSDVNTFPGSSTPLLTYAKPEQKSSKLPKVDPPKSVEDSVWYWLNQQAMLGLSQAAVPNTSSVTMVNDQPTQSTNSSYQNSSWFWKWYKQFASTQISQSPTKPILYQQLTKDKDNNTENLQMEEKPKNSTKARAVLDNLLLHNNNNVATANKKEFGEEDLSQTEALEHGEKFLKWLESCGCPSVTAMQIMQLKGLLHNIKTGHDRRNNDHSKAKVKRK